MNQTTEADAPTPSAVGGIENLAVRTLGGDVRDAMLNRLKFEQGKKAWDERSEDEQRTTINQITQVAEAMVRGAVRLIAASALPALRGTLDSVTVKDGVKAVLKFSSSDEERHALYDAQGKQIVLVIADPTTFFGTRKEWELKKDQPGLPLETEAAPEPDPETYWVLGTAAEPGDLDPRHQGIMEALVEAGADFLDPREMHSSGWVMSRWGVLIQGAISADGAEREPDQFRVFNTHSAADAYCQDVKSSQQQAALAGIIADGEPTPLGGDGGEEQARTTDIDAGAEPSRKSRKAH